MSVFYLKGLNLSEIHTYIKDRVPLHSINYYFLLSTCALVRKKRNATLRSQIKGYTRLSIFRKFSILPAVI